MKSTFACASALLVCLMAAATNYEEDKVGNYALPDPLVCNDGTRVTNAESWFAKRRPEDSESLPRRDIWPQPGRGHQRHVQRLGSFPQRAWRRGGAQAN